MATRRTYRARTNIERDYAKGYPHCSCTHSKLWHSLKMGDEYRGECEKCVCPKFEELNIFEATNDHRKLSSDRRLLGTLPRGFSSNPYEAQKFKKKSWKNKLIEILKK